MTPPDQAARIEEDLAPTVVPARYLMSAPPFTPTPGPEAEIASLRARVDELTAALTTADARVEQARRDALEEMAKYHATQANYATAACWTDDAYVAGNANERLRVHERAAEHIRALIEKEPTDV